ncbi:MAG: DUF3568 family protein [Thermosulfidibacteraceae bacterium]|jgi:hypothetical protein
MRKKLFLLSILVILLIGSQVGCIVVATSVGAAGGIAGYRYVKEKLEITYNIPYDTVRQAIVRSLEKLAMVITEYRYDGLEGIIKAKTKTDTPVEIHFKKIGKEATLVTIKVGIFGNKVKSLAIKEEIDRQLGIKGGYL